MYTAHFAVVLLECVSLRLYQNAQLSGWPTMPVLTSKKVLNHSTGFNFAGCHSRADGLVCSRLYLPSVCSNVPTFHFKDHSNDFGNNVCKDVRMMDIDYLQNNVRLDGVQS